MHKFDSLFMLYVAISERVHISSTRCDHCRTLLAYQLKIFRVVLQPQHNN